MSDIQSVPPLSGRAVGKTGAVKWVDANTVIQHILQNIEAEHRKDVVLRCDELAYVQGTAEEVEIIFSALLQLILQTKETLPRLFLHISCKNSPHQSAIVPGRRLISIQFVTNITPGINWMPLYEQAVTTIAAAVQRTGGTFEVLQGTSQGCIFSVSLPGKPL